MIDWSKVTREHTEKALKIIGRYEEKSSVPIDRLSFSMDIEAAASVNNLDLDKLLSFGDGDFWHDVTGIRENLDRTSGKFLNCFEPRCGRRS